MNDAIAARLRAMLGPVSWAVDRISLEGDVLDVDGWLYADASCRDDLEILINGRAFDERRPARLRPRLGTGLWYLPGAAHFGFALRARLAPEEIAADAIEIGVHRRSTGTRLDECWMAYPGAAARDAKLPMPEPSQLARVANSPPQVFRMQGLSVALQLAAVAQRYGRAIGDGVVALDWGCGCGRVARFWPEGSPLIGVDVDAENVEWCRAHLPGTYALIAPEPPTQLPSASIDVAFGISVISHLPTALRQAWLEEFDRIVRPGGLVMLSFLGKHGTARAGIDAEHLQRLEQDGELFVATDEVIDRMLGDRGLYGTSYIMDERALTFRAGALAGVAVLRAAIANHQDLLVLKKHA